VALVVALLLFMGISWFAQLSVQRARDRVNALTEYSRVLRDDVFLLRHELDSANRRAAILEAQQNTCATVSQQQQQQQQQKQCQLSEAFLTFVELDRGTPTTYIALARVLIKSIVTFSTRPVVVFGAAVDTNSRPAKLLREMAAEFPRDRVIVRYVRPAPHSLFFSKIKAVIASGIGCGIYVDADALVNYRVDDLFRTCQARRAQYPLLVAHNNDPANQGPLWTTQLQQSSEAAASSRPKSAPYAWAASFMWSEEALPFLLDTYERCVAKEFTRANFDETALNTLLWERNITEQACVYCTYPRAGELEQWYFNQSWPPNARYSVHDIIAFHVSSGGKNPGKSEALLRLYEKGAQQQLKVYYNQRTGRWLHSEEAGLCLVNPPLEESRAKATMLHAWSKFPWEERRDCCKQNKAYAVANLP